MNLVTRFRIVGREVVGLGAFLLLLVVLQWREAPADSVVGNFGWVYAVIGTTMILVGSETVALVRHIPR
jgi:hypothetical protein